VGKHVSTMAQLLEMGGFGYSWEGKGNTPLLCPNKRDVPPQLMLKDVIDINLVWKGQFKHI